MKQEYTLAELEQQLTALRKMFDVVLPVDPETFFLLDPKDMQITNEFYDVLPTLDANGRAWQTDLHGENNQAVLYQMVYVDGVSVVLVCRCALNAEAPSEKEGHHAKSFHRSREQYVSTLYRDYITGVYNERFVEERYLPDLREQAESGADYSVALVRVNEYDKINKEYGHEAVERCLTVAAGILQLHVGTEPEKGILARLEDGNFLVTAMHCTAKQLDADLRAALNANRKVFNLSLSRRGEFTAAVGTAQCGEASDWKGLLAAAAQRLK